LSGLAVELAHSASCGEKRTRALFERDVDGYLAVVKVDGYLAVVKIEQTASNRSANLVVTVTPQLRQERVV
jgi:hypothetical protein